MVGTPRPARHRRARSRSAERYGTFRPFGLVVVVVLVVLLAVGYVVVQLVRTVPAVAATASSARVTLPGTPATLAWPSQGQAAIGIEGTGVLGVHGAGKGTALASVTKLMTAYIVLHDHPLASGQTGPDIPISAADVGTYQQEHAAGDSVVAVSAGEQLSELQALEALLIPSGDNIATLLASWDAGSEAAFVTKMNAAAKSLGLTDTHYADASGVTTGTESTAAAQVRLAMDDMALPAFRAVVDMPQVTLPVAGVQYNVDAELGKHGIVGIKTGYTTVAGGCFVFAANAVIAGASRLIVGAVLRQFATPAQPSALTAAFDASIALLTSAEHGLETSTVVHTGETLGHLHAPWASPVALVATRTVTLTGLAGQRATTTVTLPSSISAPLPAHTTLGTAVVRLGSQRVSVQLMTSRALAAASLGWRLTDV
jgi:D-alanyl-D-alanine carboxypeptidase (penicillin-binding protein 5/6)